MVTRVVLERIRIEFEQYVLGCQENFRRFESDSRRCRKKACMYCARCKPLKERHYENVRLLRVMLDGVTDRSVTEAKLTLSSRPGYGHWNGYIAPNGYFMNARVYDGQYSTDIGHTWLREEFALVCGEGASHGLLKVHAQASSSVILKDENPVLTTAQLDTLRAMVILTPEPFVFLFHYNTNHPSKDIGL